MINRMVNLTCEKGHKKYSPDPDFWVGKACGAPTGKGKACSSLLQKMKD